MIRARAPNPIAEDLIESTVMRCQQSGAPLGETLVRDGVVSAEGFVEALRRHTAESLIQLLARPSVPRWVPRSSPEYDLRFSFTAAHVLTTLGAALEGMLDYRLDERVPWIDKHSGGLVAYRRGDVGVVPVAMHAVPHWSATELWDIGRWAVGYHDMTTAMDPGAWLSCAGGRDQSTLVILKAGMLYYLLTCERREQVSRILHELITDRQRSGSH